MALSTLVEFIDLVRCKVKVVFFANLGCFLYSIKGISAFFPCIL